jgi:molybdenum cofactor cytidylyltransferase
LRDIGLVILAAGASTRLGRPKQLLPFGGRSLLRRTAEEAVASGCRPVVAVLGACLEPSIRELAGLPVRVVENRAWSEGIAASIRAGIESLEAGPEGDGLEGVVLAVCDQPHFTADLVRRVVAAYRNGDGGPVAASYAGTLGVPALFPRALFPALLSLRGTVGARQVLRAHAETAQAVPFPEGVVDIDTQEDYAQLDQLTSEGRRWQRT